MPNLTTPRGAKFTGTFYDAVTPALKIYNRGTLVGTISGNDLTLADKLTVTGTSTHTGVTTIGAYAMPTAAGGATEQLQTDGSGTATWEAAS